jgi:protein SCO1/2
MPSLAMAPSTVRDRGAGPVDAGTNGPGERRTGRGTLAVVSRITVLALVAAAALAGCGDVDPDDEGFTGIVRDPPPQVGDLSLPDATAGGAPFPIRADDGEILLLYFGYTACPDVCPTSLSDVRAALRRLGDDAARVELAMATVDPGRDTGEILTAYVDSFVEGGHALRTEDDAELRAVTDEVGASYTVTTTASGDVEVGHTAFLYAVDEAGTVRLTWPFGARPADIAADLDRLFSRQ